MTTANDVVITGLGLVSGAGVGADAQLAFLAGPIGARKLSLTDFKPAPYFSDKKMLKAMSHTDAIGLAAVEMLKKDAGWGTIGVTPERIGMYVGAPPSGASDNAYYMEEQRAARDEQGKGSLAAFGKTCMGSKPSTLLIGLPNNVLCYGAMVLDARGPNSNYTSSGPSGMIAVMNGAKRVARGQLDLAVAGGFSAYHSDPMNKEAVISGGRPEAPVADGAAFVTLERRAAAEARGAKTYATVAGYAQGSDGMGPWAFDPHGAALENAVRRAMQQAGLGAGDVGLVLVSGTGTRSANEAELAVLARVFPKGRDVPALGAFSRAFGNLVEAGGVMELALAARIVASGALPASLALTEKTGPIDRSKPGILVLRTSFSGDYACVALRGD